MIYIENWGVLFSILFPKFISYHKCTRKFSSSSFYTLSLAFAKITTMMVLYTIFIFKVTSHLQSSPAPQVLKIFPFILHDLFFVSSPPLLGYWLDAAFVECWVSITSHITSSFHVYMQAAATASSLLAFGHYHNNIAEFSPAASSWPLSP